MRPKKYDRQQLGLFIGLVSPVIGFLLYGTGWGILHGRNFSYFLHEVFLRLTSNQSAILSLSVLIDLIPFFIFLRTDRLRSARGVLASIFVYMPIIVYLKFFA